MLLCHVFFVDQIDGNWDIKSQKIIKAAAESAADIAKPWSSFFCFLYVPIRAVKLLPACDKVAKNFEAAQNCTNVNPNNLDILWSRDMVNFFFGF